MSMNVSCHPDKGVYKVTAHQSKGTIWVSFEQEDSIDTLVLFFDSLQHAESVAAAFNGALHLYEPETEHPTEDIPIERDVPQRRDARL